MLGSVWCGPSLTSVCRYRECGLGEWVAVPSGKPGMDHLCACDFTFVSWSLMTSFHSFMMSFPPFVWNAGIV